MHGPLRPEETKLMRRLPGISRAREHRLYGLDGSRWIDCWADGGRVLEGHRPGGLSRRIKNEIDRGLYAPYPSRWEGRLEKALMKAFPGYAGVHLYGSVASALVAIGTAKSGSEEHTAPADPLDLPAGSGTRISGALWGRPLLPDHPVADILLPIMPFSGLGEAQPVLFMEGHEPESPSEIISPIILAALTRVIQPVMRGKLPFATESSDIWERRGPYMCFRGDESDYPALFDTMFNQNVLIAPSACRPSVFPAQPNAKEAELILGGDRR